MGIINPCPCDCFGTLNFQSGETLYTANICPQCDDPTGSTVTITTQFGVFFQSTFVNPSSCVTTGGGTTLVASGEGLVNGQPATFTIFLQESIRIDQFGIIIQTLRSDGDQNNSIIIVQVPDDAITINECP